MKYKGAVQVCGTSTVRYEYYTSNLTGPRAHNIIYFNHTYALVELGLKWKSHICLLYKGTDVYSLITK